MSPSGEQTATAVELLTREVVTVMAPEELAFLPATCDAYFDRVRLRRRRRTTDDMLGYGLAEAASLVSPVVVAVVASVVQHLSDQAGQAVARRSVTVWGSLRQRWRRSPEAEAVNADRLARLTPEDLVEVARLAQLRSSELGLDDDRTNELVEALLAALRNESQPE
ncbi:hypothetical protein P3T35_004081 [Kitasatospora sp. GP30]|uniref:hypothetical protein n=1 Tax=Kitasatospora sp. GP30 TaxID=3035084 RepID=UPI00117CDB6B|nr:hypothetical protein [Kitasatospora sp. GP30]MDH6142060.1 hypothetical protein [Kitasatospora sp. GP30]